MTFQFHAASNEDLERLRGDTPQCIVLLSRSKPLASKLASDAGIYTLLTDEDEEVLQSFHLVQQAYTGYEYESAFDGLCNSAGLLPSDAGLLGGRIEVLFREREPTVYQAEAVALMEQWLQENGEPEE
ncbi:MAG: hypothetical protein H0V70_30120 [Ktedonobacteraceae bacterium]|nr:hypothetical protein [Ktedonobacteraceae bacterium]